MNKHWRPDWWFNRYRKGSATTDNLTRAEVYEAGADALLDALFKLAKESPIGTFVIDSNEPTFHSEIGVEEKEV